MNENKTTNNTQISEKKYYSESKGTGVISTLIFAIAVIIFMALLVHFKGA